jgi:riboflavin kinase/FMN adenylyltransferase
MELIRGYHNLSRRHYGCVITMGNFDGMHRGHQKIIDELERQSQNYGLPSVLLTFEPLPQEYFAHHQKRIVEPKARLMRLREKLLFLQNHPVDRVLVLRFNQTLAEMKAEDFVRDFLVFLVEKLGVRHVIVGEDFRFGYQREGNVALLHSLGKLFHFTVTQIDPVYEKQKRISSTMIRHCLARGDIQTANHLLNHPYGMSGRVVHGKKLGRQWGIPTANIFLHRALSPLFGIFVVRVHGLTPNPLPGVASLGNRPTLSGDNQVLLEVHLLDFDRDIYGKYVHVEFLKKCRDEEKFESIDELKRQIFKDIEEARVFFFRK